MFDRPTPQRWQYACSKPSCRCNPAAGVASRAMSSAYSSGGIRLPLHARLGRSSCSPRCACRHHLTLKAIYVKAKEGGAQGAALVEANAGLEAGGRAISNAHRHGQIGIQRLHTPQTVAAEAAGCQHLSQQLPVYAIIGFAEVQPHCKQLLAPAAVLVLQGAQH